eukprot:4951168-Amphidinium_carterae.1
MASGEQTGSQSNARMEKYLHKYVSGRVSGRPSFCTKAGTENMLGWCSSTELWHPPMSAWSSLHRCCRERIIIMALA